MSRDVIRWVEWAGKWWWWRCGDDGGGGSAFCCLAVSCEDFVVGSVGLSLWDFQWWNPDGTLGMN